MEEGIGCGGEERRLFGGMDGRGRGMWGGRRTTFFL